MTEEIQTCVIPCAGLGMRARPHTEVLPKPLLPVCGKPVIHHLITMIKTKIGIEHFILVVGHLGEKIRRYLGNGRSFGVSIEYIHNDAIGKGLPWSLYCARNHVNSPFLVVLGDEYYSDSNHDQLKQIPLAGNIALCGLMKVGDPEVIKENYTVNRVGEKILSLCEKPSVCENNTMGTGTFVFSQEIFECIEEWYQENTASSNLIELLNDLCQAGYGVGSFAITGRYVNINNEEALIKANALCG